MKLPEGQVDSSPEEDFRAKVDYMLEDLSRRGLWRSTIAPPFFRVAWSLGWQLVPPLFASTWKLAMFLGAWWGAGTTALMWLVEWRYYGVQLIKAVEVGVSFGLLFGVPTALYYRIRAKQLRLPSWERYAHR